MFDIFVTILLFLILVFIVFFSFFYYYKGNSVNGEIQQDALIEGKNATIKQLFNQKNKLLAKVNTFLSLDSYVTYISWEYVENNKHMLVFQLNNVNGLWAENNSGKSVLLVNGYTVVAQYATVYNKDENKMTISILDQDNKVLNVSGKIAIKLVMGNST